MHPDSSPDPPSEARRLPYRPERPPRGRAWPWIVLGLFLGAVGTLFFQQWGKPKDLREMAERTRAKVLLLEAFDENGAKISFGTGFLIGPELVATNAHVVEKGYELTATDSVGRTYKGLRLEALDRETDLALVQIDDCDLRPLRLANDLEDVGPGSRVVVIGNPEGFEGTITEGVVSSIQRRWVGLEQIDELQISAALSPGSSGSPVVDTETGKVVGVATRITEGDAVNFAVGIEALHNVQTGLKTHALPQWANSDFQTIRKDLRIKDEVAEYRRLVKASDYEQAAVLAEQILARHPDNAVALRIRGMSLKNSGQLEEALSPLRRATEIEGELGFHWHNLANALFKLGRIRDAAEAYQKVIECSPARAEVRAIYIYLCHHAGWKTRAKEALQELRRFEEIDDELSIEDIEEAVGEMWKP